MTDYNKRRPSTPPSVLPTVPPLPAPTRSHHPSPPAPKRSLPPESPKRSLPPESGPCQPFTFGPAVRASVTPKSGAKRQRLVDGHADVLDKLGKILTHNKTLFSSVHSVSSARRWKDYVSSVISHPSISPTVGSLPHPAASYLQHLRLEGAPVDIQTPDWTLDHLDSCIQRGCHKSAQDHAEFVREEMADFCAKGFWTVLPYHLIRDLPGLRLSPLGCVPQRDRRPRLIVDLTFFGVNRDTTLSCDPSSMQFGRTLDRLLYRIRHADPRHGPVYMSKIDISDGFYRIRVKAEHVPRLAVIMPRLPGEPPMVAFPLALPMGWVESPPVFCAATETAADIANSRVHAPYCPPHRLDQVASTPPPPDPAPVSRLAAPSLPSLPTPSPHPSSSDTSRLLLPNPLHYVDVYVDDFISLVQGNARRRTMVRRHLMHTIDEIFAPLAADAPPLMQEPMSVKKFKKGDGAWATRKIVLGWLIDTVARTLCLPTHRYDRLRELFDDLRGKTRVAVRTWHRVLGELRSMVRGIPGGQGLFSTLQQGLRHAEHNRLRINTAMRDQLTDFEAIADNLHHRPTRLAELVPDTPRASGASDAAKPGMGGVWFTSTGPILWRTPFLPCIQRRLVSDANPTGDLTNSDLEHAGVIAHADVAAQHFDVREATLSLLNDNITALSRSRRGSVTSDKTAAYLLRLASLHQRHFRYLAHYDYIAGPANVMADDCSRLWHLSDTALLSHFEQRYPQKLPWRLCQLRPEMNTALTSALCNRRQQPATFLNEPAHVSPLGECGWISARSTTSPALWKASPILSRTFRSLADASVTDAYPKAASPTDLEAWRTPFVRSARRMPHWGPVTPACLASPSTPGSVAN